jgi:N-acetylglutamate synthase-like GNAT family acetyltransferase
VIRRARPEEAARLSEIALRAKASWGYSAEFMRSCRAELTVSADDVVAGTVFAVERDGRVVGFYALERISDAAIELEHLFVEPEAMGAGVGRALLEHARAHAAERGFRTLVIQSDPNAEGFYRALGAERVGARESASVPARLLPLLELGLAREVVRCRGSEDSGAPPPNPRS